MDYNNMYIPIPNNEIFLNRIKNIEIQRKELYDKLVLDQLKVISRALNDALEDPNMTEVELIFTQQIENEVKNKLYLNGYKCDIHNISNSHYKVRIYPYGNV